MSDQEALAVSIVLSVLFLAIAKTLLDLTKNQDGSSFF